MMIGNSVNTFESQGAATEALAEGEKKSFSAGVQRIYENLQNNQDLWMLHLPPAGTGTKDPHVKASKAILRISEVKLHVVEKELKFGLCLEGTCNFTLRGGGLSSSFCSSQYRAIDSNNSSFSNGL